MIRQKIFQLHIKSKWMDSVTPIFNDKLIGGKNHGTKDTKQNQHIFSHKLFGVLHCQFEH